MFKRIKSIKTTGRKWTDRSQLLNLCVQPWLWHITVRIIKSYELYVQYLDLIAYYLCLLISWEMFVIQYCVAVLLLFLSTLQRLLLAVFRRSCFLAKASQSPWQTCVHLCFSGCYVFLCAVLNPFSSFHHFFLFCIHPSCKKSYPVILAFLPARTLWGIGLNGKDWYF